MKVLVFGASGMLGSMVLSILGQAKDLEVSTTLRNESQHLVPSGTRWQSMDAATVTSQELASLLEGVDWAVNCTGVIKQRMREDKPQDIEEAIRVNALFPQLLANAAGARGCKVLQIATDCVYSGNKGHYLESDPHDPLDAYGKTKSLGEVRATGFHNVRCSIIGPEWKDPRSLLGWFLAQPKGAAVTGYQNHYWNGVTTLHFARICLGIIRGRVSVPHLVHVIPADILSKGELLQSFAKAFCRQDLLIEVRSVPHPVDRSLATTDPALNREIWTAAGYPEPPKLDTMVEELAQFIQSGGGNLQ